MAESDVVSHPWDPDDSEEGLQSVGENEKLQDALMDNCSELSKKMKLSDTFWSLLVQRGVVDEEVKAKILAAKTVRAQAMALVQHVLTLEVYKLHGFVWALVNSNQCHMAELLGFSADDYLDMDVFMKSSSFCCPACLKFYTKAYILTGCGHYVCRPCAKGAQFICKDNKKEDITCPVSDCRKTTETAPSEGRLGLDEDAAFKDLCDIFVNRLTENRKCAKKHSENVELKHENVDKVKVQIEKLKKKVDSLEKFRKNLGEQEATLRDHVRLEQEKIRQFAHDWAQKNLKMFAAIEHQVDKKLHQSVQWKKVASELSVFLRTQPWLSEVGQNMENVVTKEADSPLPTENLMKHLDSGHSILTIIRPYELKETSVALGPGADSGPAAPTKAKFLKESHFPASKLAWMSDGELIVLTSQGAYQLDIHTGSTVTILSQTGIKDMDFSTHGTLVLTLTYEARQQGVIRVCEHNSRQMTDVGLSDAIHPYRVFINSHNIYVLGLNSRKVRRFDLKYQYEGIHDVGLLYLPPITGYIHVTEKGTLLASAPDEHKIYSVDLETNTTSHFSSTGGKNNHLTSPQGVCSVNGGEHILVCDSGNDRVCVFSHGGSYLHDLVVENGLYNPGCIAVLARTGQPTLLALTLLSQTPAKPIRIIRVYSLE